MRRRFGLSACALGAGSLIAHSAGAGSWDTYGGNAQHTAVSTAASQALKGVKWSTPVDLQPQLNGDELLAHYGSPVITAANTVIVPVKTGVADGFRLEAHDGTTGAVKWTADSTYALPAHNWTPAYAPALTPGNGRVYYAGPGGTVYYRSNLDSSAPTAATQVAFFGNAAYAANPAAFDASVRIDTPITPDAAGNVYFGFTVSGSNPLNLQSGIARIAPDGTATYTSALAASQNDFGINKVVMNCAPAVSGNTLYVAVSAGSYGRGDLVALNATTLAPVSKVALKDPKTGNDASLPDDGTASPTVGTDGRVYMGVLGSPFGNGRGWLLNFNGGLTQQGAPGSFGWDDTPSVVASSLVPSYAGSSPYLLMAKYNDYASLGGDGVNKLAILDPNDTQVDPRTGATVMKEVLTIAGVTPDADEVATHPGAVREWCINTAAVDPATKSVLVNSEDGRLYRWDLTTNTFTEMIALTDGLLEAYTPTVIGPDGTVYSINDATLFAVGAVPEPGVGLFGIGAAIALSKRRRPSRPGR
jgi:hypothetical protein